MRGDRGIWEISVSFAQLCCEPKTGIKIVYSKKEKKKRVPGWLRQRSVPLDLRVVSLSPTLGIESIQNKNLT